MRTLRRESGAAMVEFSIVALLFLTVLFGLIEIGRVFFTYTTIVTAARAAARYAVVNGATSSSPSGPANDPPNVVTVVTNLTTIGGLVTANIQTPMVTYPDGTNTIGSRVKVTVAYPYTSLVSVMPLNVTLTSTTEATICY
jgi:Flp pilus assembly protein TadG